MECVVCGAPLAEGTRVCPVCGSPVGVEEGDEASARSRRIARVAIAIVLIFALTFGSILTLLVLFAGRNGYSPAAEREFITACVQGGSTESSCRCALNELEKRYTPREFRDAIDGVSRTGTIPRKFFEAFQACAAQPSSGPTPA
jgi:hypothetical protein